MHAFYTVSRKIADALSQLPELSGVPVVVDRKNDLETELQKLAGKVNGRLVVVAWNGGKNRNPSAAHPRLESTFSVTLISRPILETKDAQNLDHVIDRVASAIHHLSDTTPTAHQTRLELLSIQPADLGAYYAISATFQSICSIS